MALKKASEYRNSANGDVTQTGIQILTNKNIGDSSNKFEVISPSSDSTSAIKITKADGTTAIIIVDTTNSSVQVHSTNTTTPTKLSVANEYTGQNTSGSDYEISAVNIGNSAYNASISTKIPNGSWGDGCRMDLSTPSASNSNVQVPRVSVLPFSGNVGIGITTPDSLLTVKGLTADGSTNIINGLDSNDASVFKVDTDGKLTTKEVFAGTISTADGTNGYVTINTDSASTKTGFIEWRLGNGARLGFMGDNATNIALALENGAKFEVNGFTKLGSDAPAIKQKKLIGTCASIGTSVSVAHGLIQSKIISVSVLVLDSDGNLNPPFRGDLSAYQYYSMYTDSINVVIATGTNATKTAERPITILITYEE